MERNATDQLLRVCDVARLLAVKESTIRAWLLRRKLPRVKCGRAVRIPSLAVSLLVEQNTIPAKE